MDILLFKRGYFGLWGNTHILVSYTLISFHWIKVRRVEVMDMVIMGVKFH